MSVFDRMITEDFIDCYLKHVNKKPQYTKDFSTVQKYITGSEYKNDVHRLRNGDYFIGIPVKKNVRKSGSMKFRTVYMFYGKDSMLLKALAYALHEYDYLFSDSLYSFRKGKRLSDAFESIKNSDYAREKYVFKTDVSDFGSSVDQDILIEVITPMLSSDSELLSFLKWILTRNQYTRDEKIHHERVSIINGLPIGQFLTNCYLLDVDAKMRELSNLYIRFNDDIAVYADSFEEAKAIRSTLENMLKEKNMRLNEEKTEIIKPDESFDLLGIKIMKNDFGIADHSMDKIMRRIRLKKNSLLRRIRSGEISRQDAELEMIKYNEYYFFRKEENAFDTNLTAWFFPIITCTDFLKTIDHSMQDAIRIVGSGKLTDSKYRITYKQMKSMGYHTLMQKYYR